MSSKLSINVNDASIVVPDTSGDNNATTPDTGSNTILAGTNYVNDNGTSMILPIFGISLLVLLIITAIITTTVRRHKTVKTGKFSINNTKRLIARVTTLSIVILLAMLTAVNSNNKQEQVEALTSEDELTITTSDITIDVDLNDAAVFAAGESTITVDAATEAGYTLMAYVDSATTDLINETDKSSISTITMLDANLKTPKKLEDNTWGMTITEPTSQEDGVFRGLPTTLDNAVTLKYTEDATTANDKTTIYYGTYITPDLDYGTYSGTTITYIAIANYAGPCNPYATTIQEAICMQDFAGPNRDQIVDSMTPETQYTLMDMRDEKTYTIAKLRQYAPNTTLNPELPLVSTSGGPWEYGVWMTQNLDLDLDSTITYTNEDTDLGYNPQTKQYETASWKPSRSTYAVGTATWRNSTTTPESYDAGDLFWSRENEISSDGIKQYHLGNYYNWSAAVASNDSSVFASSDDGSAILVEQSICPAGWTLPRAGYGNDSFASLWSYYYNDFGDGSVLWLSPIFVPASGWYTGSEYPSGINEYAWLWSSGYTDYAKSAYIYTSDNDYDGNYDASTYYGLSVRCIARPVSDVLSFGEDY